MKPGRPNTRGRLASPVVLWIPVLAGLLPFVGTHAAYAIASAAEHVPSCWPYFEGCTSISATGRKPPASFVFRGTMMPAAVVMFIYWSLARRWLGLHGDDSLSARLLPWLGFSAMLFMIVYSAVLGHIGEWIAIARRISVVSYLSVNLVAQLLFANRFQHLTNEGRLDIPRWILGAKVTLCGVMLLVGLMSIPKALFYPESGHLDNVIEWNYSLLLVCYFPLTAFAWHADGFHLSFAVKR